jgi:5-methyltetrahydrofolate--homocysteine methyltransferase
MVGIDRPFIIIGEKINPTGRKKLAAALTEGNLDYVCQLAESQVAWGAVVSVPLCLDSGNPEVLAAGLAVAPGKPLVNSVSGEEKRLMNVLPLVKEHGAAVIGLTMDDNGIPKTAEERVAVAEKIIERAVKMGIPVDDIVIDPLVLTVGSDSQAALVTLQTIDLVRKEFGVNTNLGASNVSFGLPDRLSVNQAFLALAIQLGATCSITDPTKLGATIKAVDLLLGRDDNSLRYIKYFRAAEKLREQEATKTP